MTVRGVKLLVTGVLTSIDDPEVKKAVAASQKISSDLISRLSHSADSLNKWIQNYGDVIGLSSKQVLTADQIVRASAAHDAKLKSVMKMADLSEEVQQKLANREKDLAKTNQKQGQSLGF